MIFSVVFFIDGNCHVAIGIDEDCLITAPVGKYLNLRDLNEKKPL